MQPAHGGRSWACVASWCHHRSHCSPARRGPPENIQTPLCGARWPRYLELSLTHTERELETSVGRQSCTVLVLAFNVCCAVPSLCGSWACLLAASGCSTSTWSLDSVWWHLAPQPPVSAHPEAKWVMGRRGAASTLSVRLCGSGTDWASPTKQVVGPEIHR